MMIEEHIHTSTVLQYMFARISLFDIKPKSVIEILKQLFVVNYVCYATILFFLIDTHTLRCASRIAGRIATEGRPLKDFPMGARC